MPMFRGRKKSCHHEKVLILYFTPQHSRITCSQTQSRRRSLLCAAVGTVSMLRDMSAKSLLTPVSLTFISCDLQWGCLSPPGNHWP